MSATRVMVVEDEPIVALNLKEQLLRLGYAVVGVAASGRQTLSLLDQVHPDVVLMDINLQGDLDGIETAARIPGDLFVPVIYLTAYAEEATIRRARETSPCGYLLKPFSERELHATIQMGLARSDADRAIRSREQLFRDFSLMASDWFWEQDADLRFQNVAVYQRRGEGNAEICVQGKTRLELIGDGIDKPRREAHLADLIARRPFRDFEFEQLAVDGSIHHFSVSGDPIFDSDGTFMGYRGIGRDITERVRREALLEEARSEAEAANRAKTEFLASMSHEFRTPLNAILGFSEIIRDEIVGGVQPPVYRDYGGYIHEAGGHLLSLINNVLDLSKMEAGRFELHLEAVSVHMVIAACRSMIYGSSEKAGVAVNIDVAPDVPKIMLDALRAKQILLNLLSNAVKFTPMGGTVTVRAARTSDGGVVVSVADTGIGMRPEDIPVALTPFQQIDGVLTRRYQGTGLGLSLAKRLAELHEGTLEIESALGAGTTVRVRFPGKLIPV